jgi:phosphatidylinositol-3-phosphatase
MNELGSDLRADTIADYNFITPDLCNDMHNSKGCVSSDSVKNGDDWLAQAVPGILGSKAYARGGALFVTWDESEHGDFPIGMIALSKRAKGQGYANKLPYTHSSPLRTVEELLAVGPLLGDAANAKNLSDLFVSYP